MFGQQFYSLNENRAYPFDAGGLLLSDAGDQLPEGLLVDAGISFDRQYGTRLRCTAISKTAAATAIVLGTSTQASLAIATIPEGFTPRQAIPIDPIIEGVSGFVTPGEPLARLAISNWLFSGDRQLLLSPRVAFPVRLQNSQSFAALNSAALLSGMVLLEGLGDMNIRIEPRVLGGQQKTAIVFRLTDVSNQVSVLQQYSGSRQQRPESRTCGEPFPIETINQVAADCCGRIYIELRGCAQPIPITNHCGVVLDCPQEPEELCPPKKTYNETAGDSQDQCVAQGEPDPLTPPANPPKLPNWFGSL